MVGLRPLARPRGGPGQRSLAICRPRTGGTGAWLAPRNCSPRAARVRHASCMHASCTMHPRGSCVTCLVPPAARLPVWHRPFLAADDGACSDQDRTDQAPTVTQAQDSGSAQAQAQPLIWAGPRGRKGCKESVCIGDAVGHAQPSHWAVRPVDVPRRRAYTCLGCCVLRATRCPLRTARPARPPAACPAACLRAPRGARAVHARVRRRLRCSAPVSPALQRPDTSTPSGDRHQPVTARHPSGHAAQRMCDVPLASAACAARNTQEPRRCAVSPPTGPSVKQVNPSTNEQQTRSDRVCLTREA